MKHRMTFIAGAAIGYVLGTKAGQERYEQLKRFTRQLQENPNVQDAKGMLRAKGEEFAGAARDKAGTMRGSKEHVPEQAEHRERPTVYPG
ncbi:YtxH domain-containing protein [Actinomadura algeriensis]|uniref:YtxH domain-containing protein n=1 Tax=Actinomadura algeriensis TaxID=1679523 RepID=A0ABR9JWT7_9ACTN|nr:YtxH domain-containing protein [Actinomadura algeriensis]MBE1535042.1 hypothetical protein [Actinomadura algeriensis]